MALDDEDDWMSPKKAKKRSKPNGRYKSIDDKPYERPKRSSKNNKGEKALREYNSDSAKVRKRLAKQAEQNAKRIVIKKRIFLGEIIRTGLIAHSAHVAGWTSSTVKGHRDSDPEFEDAFQEAMERHRDGLEAEAKRRGTEGDVDIVVQAGRVVYMTDPKTGQPLKDPLTGEYIPIVRHNKSDKLLELMLKAERPEKFRENIKVDHSVSGGVLVVGAIGQPTEKGKALGLTLEEEIERHQAQYRNKDIIEGEIVKDEELTPLQQGVRALTTPKVSE